MSVRFPITLFVALTIVPGQALAEGWIGFFDVMALGLLLSVYVIAAKGVWWFLAGAVLAWGFHFYRGADLERVHGLWPLGYKAGAAPTVGRALAWHLYALRWSLTVATLIAPIIIGLGHAYGLSSKNKSKVVSPVVKAHPLAGQRWNRDIPNGSGWPTTSGYMEGMPVEAVSAQGGEFVLNNTLGKRHLYARLCASYRPRDDLTAGCVVRRNVFIKPGDSVRMSQVAKDGYALQVLDVLAGNAYVSPYIDWRQPISDTLTMDLPSGDQPHGFEPMPSGVFNAR